MEEASCDPLAPTIYHEKWWLDAATNGGDYEVVEAYGDNNRVIGRLPYFLQRRAGLKVSIPPGFTHVLGPAVDCGKGSKADRDRICRSVTRDLLRKLPPAAIYSYKCHRAITDVIAFQMERFYSSVQFTYEINPQPAELIWMGMRKKKRSQIKRAQAVIKIEPMRSAPSFWDLCERGAENRGRRNYYERQKTIDLIEACYRNGRGKILAAFDRLGKPVAAIWYIWDALSAFYIMTARITEAHDGAVSALLWEAIQDAAARGLIFDFDGVNGAESAAFFEGFGATASPRYKVLKTSAIGRIVWETKELRRQNRFFC